MVLLGGYYGIVHPQGAALPLLGILAYSAIPLLVCHRFDRYDRARRLTVAFELVLVILAVELLFLGVVFALTGGLYRLVPYIGMLVVASVIQCVLMGLAFYLLEAIRDYSAMQKRIDSLITYNPIGIAIVDDATCHVLVNPAYEALTGYAAADLIGTPWRTLAPTPRHDNAPMQRLFQGEVLRDVAYTIRHKQGHPVVVRYTAGPIRDGDRIVGFFTLLVDRTEAEQAGVPNAWQSSENLPRASPMMSAVL